MKVQQRKMTTVITMRANEHEESKQMNEISIEVNLINHKPA